MSNSKRILRFLIVGGCSTALDFSVYMVLSRFLDTAIAKCLSMSLACAFSFILNRRWVFSHTEHVNSRLITKYIIGQLLNITINTVTNSIIFAALNMRIVAFVIATGIAMIFNFLFQNFIVFTEPKSKAINNKCVKQKTFSIVFPCYNESENLENLLKALKSFPKKYDVEFILVENGSTDNSKTFFDKKISESKRIKKVYVKKNRGYGYGIIQGLKTAKGDYVGWLHSDMQYNPHDLTTFFDFINTASDENLMLKGKRKNRHIVEYIFTFGMGIVDSLIFRSPMSNVMAMPVIFHRSLLGKLAEFPKDYCIDIYIYALALQSNYPVHHLPIYLKDREYGKSSWNTGLLSRIKQSKKMIDGSLTVRSLLSKKERTHA